MGLAIHSHDVIFVGREHDHTLLQTKGRAHVKNIWLLGLGLMNITGEQYGRSVLIVSCSKSLRVLMTPNLNAQCVHYSAQ